MTGNEGLPFIRFADSILYTNKSKSFHLAYDARLFMPLADGGTVTIENEHHALKRFDIIYIPPGTPYRFECAEISPLIAVNFDFSNSFAEQKTLLSPVLCASFDPSLLHGDIPDTFRRPIRRAHAESLHATLTALIKEMRYPDTHSATMASLLLCQCLLCIERMRKKPVSSKEENLTETALAFIDEHAPERDCEEKLVALLAYHPYYINRIFKKHTGETVHSYLLRARVRLAAALLRAGKHKNEEIAVMVGLPNPAHFAKTFRHYMGMTPSAYQKSPPLL